MRERAARRVTQRSAGKKTRVLDDEELYPSVGVSVKDDVLGALREKAIDRERLRPLNISAGI